MTQPFRWTPELDAELRELRTAGYSLTIMAQRLGRHRQVIHKRIVALGLPAAPKIIGVSRGGAVPVFTDNQRVIVEREWCAGTDLDVIVKLLGGAVSAKQIRDLAKRKAWRRPRIAKPPPPPKIARVKAPTRPPIPLLLREVYLRAEQYGVPRSKRGDIAALNAAVKRAKPGHPGYVMHSLKFSSPVRWAV